MSDTNTTNTNANTEQSGKQVAIQLGGEVLLRDYFAAKAMQSFTDAVGWKSDQQWFDEIAEGAYRQADAMLKAREA